MEKSCQNSAPVTEIFNCALFLPWTFHVIHWNNCVDFLSKTHQLLNFNARVFTMLINATQPWLIKKISLDS